MGETPRNVKVKITADASEYVTAMNQARTATLRLIAARRRDRLERLLTGSVAFVIAAGLVLVAISVYNVVRLAILH